MLLEAALVSVISASNRTGEKWVANTANSCLKEGDCGML